MKKTLLALAAIALLYTACKKEETPKNVVKIEVSGLKYDIALTGYYIDKKFLDKADQTGANTYIVSVDTGKLTFKCKNYYSSSVAYKVYVNDVLRISDELSLGTLIEKGIH
ncbi:MAG TPA: hypothetical protein VGB63_16095 [Pedobacter sp.]|jgi:hypothetical protein